MEIRQFQTFEKIVETGSFTKASEEMGYAQSTVTAHIQSIETGLGGKVFDRVGKQVFLTDLGKMLLPQVRKLLVAFHKIEELQNFGDEPRGIIRIGTEESVALYRMKELLKTFNERYPEVEILLINAPYRELEPKLFSGEADIIMVMDKYIQTPGLKVIPLIEEEMVVTGSPTYLAKRDAQNERITRIINTKKGGTFRILFDEYLKDRWSKVESGMEAWSLELVKQSVVLGLGVSFLPRVTVEKEIQSGELDYDIIPLTDGNQLYTQVAYHRQRYVSPSMQAFIDTALEMQTDHVKKRLPKRVE